MYQKEGRKELRREKEEKGRRKAMIEEEIDAEMPNVVEPITIEKNDQSKLYRSI